MKFEKKRGPRGKEWKREKKEKMIGKKEEINLNFIIYFDIKRLSNKRMKFEKNKCYLNHLFLFSFVFSLTKFFSITSYEMWVK